MDEESDLLAAFEEELLEFVEGDVVGSFFLFGH